MQNFVTFVESTTTNKFNIHWQLVRTKARSIKDVTEKIEYVLNFLDGHPNKHNYNRVMNWVKMTGVAYPKGSNESKAFINMHQYLIDNENRYKDATDDLNDLTNISTDDLKLVLKDLKSRKYDFQFGKTPIAHIDFVAKLEEELEKR